MTDAIRADEYRSLFTLPSQDQLRLFADIRGLYPTRVIRRGAEVTELAARPRLDFVYSAEGQTLGIADFMQRYRAAGLLILKRADGSSANAMRSDTRRRRSGSRSRWPSRSHRH
jgi:hypothetical protein